VKAAQQALLHRARCNRAARVANTLPQWKGHEHDNEETCHGSNTAVSTAIPNRSISIALGGRSLANLLSAAARRWPIGEAWLLSDRDDHPSRVADGPLKDGASGNASSVAGAVAGKTGRALPRFPLLLKFLDVRDTLSFRCIHRIGRPGISLPARLGRPNLVVLEAGQKAHLRGPQASTTTDTLRQALGNGTVRTSRILPPKPGDGISYRRNRSLAGRRGGFEVQKTAT